MCERIALYLFLLTHRPSYSNLKMFSWGPALFFFDQRHQLCLVDRLILIEESLYHLLRNIFKSWGLFPILLSFLFLVLPTLFPLVLHHHNEEWLGPRILAYFRLWLGPSRKLKLVPTLRNEKWRGVSMESSLLEQVLEQAGKNNGLDTLLCPMYQYDIFVGMWFRLGGGKVGFTLYRLSKRAVGL